MTLEAHDVTFTRDDLDQLQRRGISLDEARRQIELLLRPPAPVTLDRACTLGDGIERVPEPEHDELLRLHEGVARSGSCHWFVPASGAASRMFKDLTAPLAPTAPERPRRRKPAENVAPKQF